jgi:hypothetical protein
MRRRRRKRTPNRLIDIAGRPGPPTIELIDQTHPRRGIRWTLESAEPIIEYRVSYRLVPKDDIWQELPYIRASKGTL